MTNNHRITCKRCGSKSFRYAIKRKKSYCVVCGLEIRPEDFNRGRK